VMTKAEIAGSTAAARVKQAVVELNGRAPWVEGTTREVAGWLDGVLEDPDPVHVHGHDDEDEHEHGHDHGPGFAHGIESVWCEVNGILDLEELIDGLEELPASYIRVKGVARAVDGRTGSGAVHFVAFHRVGARVSTEPLGWEAPTVAVALGPGVRVEALRACVERAVLSSEAGPGTR